MVTEGTLCWICHKPIPPEQRVDVDGKPCHIHHPGVIENAEGIPTIIKEVTAAGSPVRMKMAEHLLKRFHTDVRKQ